MLLTVGFLGLLIEVTAFGILTNNRELLRGRLSRLRAQLIRGQLYIELLDAFGHRLACELAAERVADLKPLHVGQENLPRRASTRHLRNQYQGIVQPHLHGAFGRSRF